MTAPSILRRLFLHLIALLAGGSLLASCSHSEETGPVVLAAASLQSAMEEVADSWAGEGNARPLLSFAATSALARQVSDGAPADLFVSADREWIGWLDERGLLVPGSAVDLLGNRLVIVGPPEGDEPVTLNTMAARLGDRRLAMADPQSVPAGRYARAALQAAGVWNRLAPRIAPAGNVRAALALVERGEAPLGIVYASDLKASALVSEAGTIPARLQPEIVYPLARLAGSRHPDAQAFAAYLQSPEAQRIFAKHGFSAIGR